MPMPGFLDARGVALPMALVTLALLTSLMLALASLAQLEPIIALNHVQGSQARSLAESGLEYALWALARQSAPADPPSPSPARSAGADLDGRAFIDPGSV
jgi:Tfp pilus assembly protein PilX